MFSYGLEKNEFYDSHFKNINKKIFSLMEAINGCECGIILKKTSQGVEQLYLYGDMADRSHSIIFIGSETTIKYWTILWVI